MLNDTNKKKNRYREKVENIITVNILFLNVFKFFGFKIIFNF